MSRLAAGVPRSSGLYGQLRERAELLDWEPAGKPVHPSGGSRERERLIVLAQLRAGYPVEVDGLCVPEEARPPVSCSSHRLLVVYPDNTVMLADRPRDDISELMYEWAESDRYGRRPSMRGTCRPRDVPAAAACATP